MIFFYNHKILKLKLQFWFRKPILVNVNILQGCSVQQAISNLTSSSVQMSRESVSQLQRDEDFE